MERIKALNQRQKWILLILCAMVVVFSVLYPVTLSRRGFAYRDTILVPRDENGSTIYSGKIQGKAASFTVTPDKTITFECGELTFGPYMVKTDSGTLSRNSDSSGSLTGVEVWLKDSLLFRGDAQKINSVWLLSNGDGSLAGTEIEFVVNWSDGDSAAQLAPSLSDILELATGPELTHKGYWFAWVGGILLCVLNAVSILFADELFRWRMAFRIESPELAEPSEWEIMGRYFGWVVVTIGALVIFILGLS